MTVRILLCTYVLCWLKYRQELFFQVMCTFSCLFVHVGMSCWYTSLYVCLCVCMCVCQWSPSGGNVIVVFSHFSRKTPINRITALPSPSILSSVLLSHCPFPSSLLKSLSSSLIRHLLISLSELPPPRSLLLHTFSEGSLLMMPYEHSRTKAFKRRRPFIVDVCVCVKSNQNLM